MDNNSNELLDIGQTAALLGLSRATIKAYLYRLDGGKHNFPTGAIRSGIRFWQRGEIDEYMKRAGINMSGTITARAYWSGNYADKLKGGEDGLKAVTLDGKRVVSLLKDEESPGYYHIGVETGKAKKHTKFVKVFGNRKLTLAYEESGNE